jgi:hypothetical protein
MDGILLKLPAHIIGQARSWPPFVASRSYRIAIVTLRYLD